MYKNIDKHSCVRTKKTLSTLSYTQNQQTLRVPKEIQQTLGVRTLIQQTLCTYTNSTNTVYVHKLNKHSAYVHKFNTQFVMYTNSTNSQCAHTKFSKHSVYVHKFSKHCLCTQIK